MTVDVLRALKRGELVYTNYRINWTGYDERRSRFQRILLRLGIKKRLKEYPATNLRYIRQAEDLFKISNATIALDEGYLYFDSYVNTKLPIKIRHWVLHLRKHHNVVIYTSQRPMQVHKVMRAMTNYFYELSALRLPGVPLFIRKEFDLGPDETVDNKADPLSRAYYFLRAGIANMYNTDEIIWDAVEQYEVDTTPPAVNYYERI